MRCGLLLAAGSGQIHGEVTMLRLPLQVRGALLEGCDEGVRFEDEGLSFGGRLDFGISGAWIPASSSSLHVAHSTAECWITGSAG